MTLSPFPLFPFSWSPSQNIAKPLAAASNLTINLQAVCAPSGPNEKMYLTTNWELPLFKWIVTLCWDVGISINLAEFAFALMLMELSLAMKKAFDNERSTKSCCDWLWYCCLNPKINLNVGCTLLLIFLRRKVLIGLFEIAFDIQPTDATTNWNVEEGLLPKEDALFILFELANS